MTKTAGLPEDELTAPWMIPLLRMTAIHLAAGPGKAMPWEWISRLSPRAMARLLMRILEAREALDLSTQVSDFLTARLGVMWPWMRMEEQAKWEPLVMEARNRSLETRKVIDSTETVAGTLPPVPTGADSREPTT